jgi:DNA-binding GntR family transcriptional regulator
LALCSLRRVVTSTFEVHDRPVSETYIAVANELEGRIRQLDVGERVPSENEVVREFSVSRPTARAALQELERRFVVRRVKGSGTYVNERIPYPIGAQYPPSASRTIALSGRTATLRVITVSEIESSLAESNLFQDNARQRLCVVDRTMEVEGEVLGFGVSKVSCSIAPGLRRHLDDISSIWRILHSLYGIRLTRRTINVAIDTPPEHVARILDTREPTWHLQSVNVDEATGSVVELGESWIRTDRVAVSVHFDNAPESQIENQSFDFTMTPDRSGSRSA